MFLTALKQQCTGEGMHEKAHSEKAHYLLAFSDGCISSHMRSLEADKVTSCWSAGFLVFAVHIIRVCYLP